jgi:hypothetical protein
MTLSWKELVCHGLSEEVGDPSLVKDLLKVVMKERWLFLEKEAREFHSENMKPLLNYIRQEKLWMRGKTIVMTELHNARANIWSDLISHRQAMQTLKLCWKQRIPEERRQAVTRHKESNLLRWRGATGDEDIKELGQQYPSIEKSIKWYGDIHEGRYYLFWDQKLALPIADCAMRRRESKAFLMSGFDINIIDGEGLNKNISDTWVYAYDQWTQNPGGWGARQFEFTMVHGRGKKEKMHIDDMFLKE